MNTRAFTKLTDPFNIGYDLLFQKMNDFAFQTPSTSFPFCNIIKDSETEYTIELALAGFTEDNISITTEHGILTVKGSIEDKEKNYIFKGISTKTFVKTFNIVDTIEILSAELSDGILQIHLKNKIPEDKKPRTIEIKNKRK
jgi:molecular chaperone IbpA